MKKGNGRKFHICTWDIRRYREEKGIGCRKVLRELDDEEKWVENDWDSIVGSAQLKGGG